MINLLPPQEKQILLKERQFREILILGLIFFLSLSLLGSILFFIKIDLKKEISSQREVLDEKRKEIGEIKDLEKEVESLNQTLLKLNSFYQERLYLTSIFEDLSNLKPPGLYINYLSYNRERREISISGFSPDRETLTLFKRNLQEKENFEEIYFPPTNWIEPVNINFSASFKIKK